MVNNIWHIVFRHKDPTNHGFWYPSYIGPGNQNVRFFCLCGLLGPRLQYHCRCCFYCLFDSIALMATVTTKTRNTKHKNNNNRGLCLVADCARNVSQETRGSFRRHQNRNPGSITRVILDESGSQMLEGIPEVVKLAAIGDPGSRMLLGTRRSQVGSAR